MSANSSNLSTLASPGAEVGFGFVITIPGILANTFAIIFFAKAARKTGLAVHYLLLSLAVTDLFGCFLASYTAATAYLGDIQSPALCNTLSFITSLCPMSTALMACLLALDRYIALCHPFKYASFATRKTAIISVLSCFGASIVLSLLPFIQLGNYYMVVTTADGEVQVICSALKFQEKPHQRIYGVLYGVVGLSIIVIVTASNFLVVKSALSMRKNVVSPQNDDQGLATVQSRYASELKFAKMVTGISVVLLFCWTPFMVLFLLTHAGITLPSSPVSTIMILASLNFIVDPFVHIFLRKSYRQAVWRTVFCCRCSQRATTLTESSTVQYN